MTESIEVSCRGRGWFGMLLAALAVIPASSARSQVPLEMADADIAGVELGRMSFDGLDASPNFNFHIFRMSDGWGVSSAAFPGDVFRFDSELRSTGMLGREGSGPGEFSGIVYGTSSTESVVVVDPRQQRVSWFTPSLEFTSDRRIPGRVYTARGDADGFTWIGGQFSKGGRIYTVMRFGPAVGDSILFAAPSISSHAPADFAAIVPPPPGLGELWAVKVSGGVIEVIDTRTLEVTSTLQIPLPRYDEIVPMRQSIRTEPPSPQVSEAASTESGLALLFVGVADENWKPNLVHPVDFYDTEIVVVAMAERTILGTYRSPNFCRPGGGSMVVCLDSDTGDLVFIRLDVVR